MSYLTVSEFKLTHFPQGVNDSLSDVIIERVVSGASSWVDWRCGRSFSLDAADVAKVYRARSTDRIDVVDLVSVTEIAVDRLGDRSYTGVMEADDFDLEPFGEPRFGAIVVRPLASVHFVPGQLVRVTGKFGYAEDGGTPPAVKQAVAILAGRWFKRPEAPFGVLQNTDLGTFSRLSQMDPDVEMLLGPYVRSSKSAWVMV